MGFPFCYVPADKVLMSKWRDVSLHERFRRIIDGIIDFFRETPLVLILFYGGGVYDWVCMRLASVMVTRRHIGPPRAASQFFVPPFG